MIAIASCCLPELLDAQFLPPARGARPPAPQSAPEAAGVGTEGSGPSSSASARELVSPPQDAGARKDSPVDPYDPTNVENRIPVAARQNPRAVAVIIGNERYAQGDIPPVKYATRDARAVRKYFTTAFGVPEENVIYHENATKGTLQAVFGTADDADGRLASLIDRPDETDVYVYYAGHGMPDAGTGKAYLMPTDADAEQVRLTGYEVQGLYANLAKLGARSLTVVVDACFSGVADGGGSLLTAERGALRVEDPILAAQNAVLITAGKSDQVAHAFDRQQHGLMTYYFLAGIRGAADRDQDGRVTARELEVWLSQEVVREARRLRNRRQEPQVRAANADRVVVEVAR
ncbi:MAG: caspase family protein [Gemmatimonadales bacterium]|nr:caspase family protein [Gemmatimonadales bacterium]